MQSLVELLQNEFQRHAAGSQPPEHQEAFKKVFQFCQAYLDNNKVKSVTQGADGSFTALLSNGQYVSMATLVDSGQLPDSGALHAIGAPGRA